MSDKKTNAPVVILIVLLALLAVPCLVGVLGIGGFKFWKGAPVYMRPPQDADTSAPMQPKDAAPAGEATNAPAMP